MHTCGLLFDLHLQSVPCRWVLSQCGHMDKISFIYQLGIITLLFKRRLRTEQSLLEMLGPGLCAQLETNALCFLAFSLPIFLPLPGKLLRSSTFVLTPKPWPRSDTVHVSSGGRCNCQNPYYHLGAALPAAQSSQPCSCPVN